MCALFLCTVHLVLIADEEEMLDIWGRKKTWHIYENLIILHIKLACFFTLAEYLNVNPLNAVGCQIDSGTVLYIFILTTYGWCQAILSYHHYIKRIPVFVTENTPASGFFQVEMSCKWVFCISFLQTHGSHSALVAWMPTHRTDGWWFTLWEYEEVALNRSSGFAFTKPLRFPMVKLSNGCLMSSKRKPPLAGSPLKSSWQKLVGFVWKTWAGCDRTWFKCYMLHCIYQRSSLWTQPGISTSTRVDDAANVWK